MKERDNVIKILTPEHKDELITLVEQDLIHNLQFVEYYPFLDNHDPRFGFYGCFENQELVGALYFSPFNMGITLQDGIDPAVFKEKLATLPSKFLYGKKDILTSVSPLPNRKDHPYSYGRLPIGKLVDDVPDKVVQATQQDFTPLLEFYEGKNIQLEMEELLPHLIDRGLVFIVKDGPKVISSALAHSITKDFCLIGAVYTDPDYQGQRLAYYSVLALTQHLHHQGITPYLFFEDHLPHLHRFYGKFGYEKEADYLMLHE